ncbi:MAG: Nif-specific regulatory protein [Desulfonauticus sp.]|jgi:Nif-specific regulatory protein|nr:MAG: Transcriptional regulator, NifA subfamily, Fis Family [Desulfonauticus sp. 38_4375]MDK2920809.1 Nif-specific regulatory protein [Desulfonauticus sp.]
MHYLRILREAIFDLSFSKPLKEGLTQLLAEVRRKMGYRHMSLAIFDPISQVIEFAIYSGYSKVPQKSYSLGEGIIGKAVKEKKPIIVPIMEEEPLFLNLAFNRDQRELRQLAFIAVPVQLINKDGIAEVFGVLTCDLARRSQVDLEEQCEFLQLLAVVIARHTSYLQDELAKKHFLPDMGPNPEKRFSPGKMVFYSKSMSQIMTQISQVAPSKATVLLRGESGTGKELLAEAIHNLSEVRDGPLVKLNCAALPSELIESELFGHEKGAFTGAYQSKKGKFELANKGTLFLDEIGELSLEAQAKLLRVIQEGEIQRVGGEKDIKVDVRIICATHQPLEELIKEGKFREDLYFRINVFPIFIPPLRERREDILPLAENFLEHYAREYNKKIKRISTPAIDLLVQYHWPGNVRELKNCIERAVLVCNEEVIRTYHLPPTLQTAESSATDNQLPFAEAVAEFEQEIIIEALKKAKGNMLQAARDLKASYRVINYKVKKYNINPKKFVR